MERKIQYAYSYDLVNDVYFIRRIDDEALGNFIPAGLFRHLAMERLMETGEPVIICDVSKTFHFSEDGTRAFIDLNVREFTAEQEQMVFNGVRVQFNNELNKVIQMPRKAVEPPKPEQKEKGFQKVLSLFKKKH